MKKKSNNNFFLDHMYDEVGSIYNIDGDQTRRLVKYLMQFQKSDNKSILKQLRNKDSKEGIERILSDIAIKDNANKMREDSLMPNDSFSQPAGSSGAVRMANSDFELSKKAYMKTAGPAFTVPVSDDEKALAMKVRKAFEKVLKVQNDYFKFMGILFDNLEELEDKTGLQKISPILKRYEHKMKHKFNAYIKEFSKALTVYENNFSDTEMDDVRDLIIENIRSIRELVIDIVVLMKDIGSKNFVQESLGKYKSLKEQSEQLEGIIKNEWFGHIDYDILGRIKLGYDLPLSKKRI